MKSLNNLPSVSRRHCVSLTVPRVLAITVGLGLALLAIPAAVAQFKVIHNFTDGGDGAVPYGGLTMDASGNLYGTTSTGGSGGSGTVYKMSFKNPNWLLGTLYTFTGGEDGGTPAAGVIRDSSGVLYGATYNGGTHGAGAVFELAPGNSIVSPWTETTLYSFTLGSDGGFPDMLGGSLSFDAADNLYGTTLYGGDDSCFLGPPGCGTVFKLTHSTGEWAESVLHSFGGGSDGALPYGGVVLDAAGNVYGATYAGGYDYGCPYGCGTVYQLVSGLGWSEKILLGFCNPVTCIDGTGPTGIAIDRSGNLYTDDDGVVVELNRGQGWAEEILHYNLCCYPVGNLIMDNSGTLYGTTVFGGAHGYGSVFELTPTGTYFSLHDFTGGRDGGKPYGTLLYSKGNLYGTASQGGTGGSCEGGCGVVFEIDRHH